MNTIILKVWRVTVPSSRWYSGFAKAVDTDPKVPASIDNDSAAAPMDFILTCFNMVFSPNVLKELDRSSDLACTHKQSNYDTNQLWDSCAVVKISQY